MALADHQERCVQRTQELVHRAVVTQDQIVLANGYTGQIAGERPYSWVKITFTVLSVILLLMLIAPLFVQN